MRSNDFCPMGADTKEAPWNKEDPKPVKVKVCVSMTLSKTVEVEVDDYQATDDIDENGEYNTIYDFSDCDLKKAVQEQVCLPNEAYEKLVGTVFYSESYKAHKAIKDLKDWDVDDYEVMLDE